MAGSMPRTTVESGRGWERSRQHVRNYGTKRLFRHDFGVFWRVINDCWLNEIAFGAPGLITASYKPVPLPFAIVQERFHFGELHSVLDGANVSIRVERIADL